MKPSKIEFARQFRWTLSPAWTATFARHLLAEGRSPSSPHPFFEAIAEQLRATTAQSDRRGSDRQRVESLAASLRQLAENPLAIALPESLQGLETPAAAALGELQQRNQLLSEQWRARGPGIWRWLNEVLAWLPSTHSPQLIAPVLPFIGGAALGLPDGRGALIEAMLFDAEPDLPELGRLTQALLLSKFARFQGPEESLGGYQVATVLALAACDYVELTRVSESLLERARSSWWPPHLPVDELRRTRWTIDKVTTNGSQDRAALAAWSRQQLDAGCS